MKNRLFAIMLGAVSACGLANSSHADSQLLPGLSTGLALGYPLPEGVYDVTMPSYGWRNTNPATNVGVLVPAWLIWSTPWTFLGGGRLIFDTATGMADIDVNDVIHKQGVANPYLDAQLKWSLGGGFFGGFQAGVYVPMEDAVTPLGAAHNFATFQGTAALTYLKDGWNLTSTLI